jgi:hypothetical protein
MDTMEGGRERGREGWVGQSSSRCEGNAKVCAFASKWLRSVSTMVGRTDEANLLSQCEEALSNGIVDSAEGSRRATPMLRGEVPQQTPGHGNLANEAIGWPAPPCHRAKPMEPCKRVGR